MLRPILRKFSQYKAPESYQDFIGKSKDLSSSAPEVFTDSIHRKSLTFRKVDLEDYDFYTETSDFDVERFNLKEYIWSVIWYRERTMIRLFLFMMSWTVFILVSKAIYNVSRKRIRKIAPIGYFGMVEPAFKDMELERFKQRIHFSYLDK